MSAGAQVAVLEPRGLRRARGRSEARPAERPLVRLAAFAALALYGVLRWGTLLTPAAVWRLLGLLALAVLVSGLGPWLRARSRPLAVLVAGVAVIAVLPLSGIPLAWVWHLRIAVTANAIGQGLSALPRASVPYTGINEWVRVVNVLGAGLLLLDAAVMMAFSPRPPSELRLAGAALPLVVLAIVPSTLARPQLAYLHGLILFGLLAVLIWGERVRRYDTPLAIGVAALAGAAAMIAAPALDEHSPWLNYQALAGTLSPGHIEAFDWSQRYGPLNWPRTGREVLDVQAKNADYWKAQDLDLFNGYGWTQGSASSATPPPPPAPESLARWTQTIQVTLRAMTTTDVIAAGFAAAPTHIAELTVPGFGDGTWTAGTELQPGDSYTIKTYSPAPSPAQLGAAGNEYPWSLLTGYRSMLLPENGAPPVIFPPFHSGQPVQSVVSLYGTDGDALVRASPYAAAFALAQRLAARAANPYAFVASVMRHLAHGYTYNEVPPQSQYPLESFLFTSKNGYCQQFAGAMALLLRMGGIPARVAAGFTSGSYDRATHQWIVSDLDAHAWVEAWFPRYGWVRFDPTPGSAPARGGHAGILPALRGGSTKAQAPRIVKKAEPLPQPVSNVKSGHGGGSPVALILLGIIAGLGLLALLALSLRATIGLREPTGDELVAELERALARCGRRVSGGVTLALLERRFRSSADAAGYVRAIRMLRFADAGELPTATQRRALRAQLGAGLGVLGRLRALWALPPRWTWHRSTRMPPSRALDSN